MCQRFEILTLLNIPKFEINFLFGLRSVYVKLLYSLNASLSDSLAATTACV
jgi:hypothetical protein